MSELYNFHNQDKLQDGINSNKYDHNILISCHKFVHKNAVLFLEQISDPYASHKSNDKYLGAPLLLLFDNQDISILVIRMDPILDVLVVLSYFLPTF